MKKLLFAVMTIVGTAAGANAQENKSVESAKDSVNVRYVYTMQTANDCLFGERKHIIFVNEEVTTHVIMPENIKLVDMSTDKIVGNQCADNIVRIKPSGRMRDYELVGTITVIGERHLAQFDVVYASGHARANSIYHISMEEMKRYKNPDVLMPESEMAGEKGENFVVIIQKVTKKQYLCKRKDDRTLGYERIRRTIGHEGAGQEAAASTSPHRNETE